MDEFPNNYSKKIQELAGMNEYLRDALVEAQQELGNKTPYLLSMLNPKLHVKNSWHNTITAAIERAKLLGGDYNIFLNHHTNRILLTMEQCEMIRQCEEGELDPEKGCSIALAKVAHAARELENLAQEDYNEYADLDQMVREICSNALTKAECMARETENYTGKSLQYADEYAYLLEEADGDSELLEMWLEKMDRPGRKLARGTDESATDILLRENAMVKIFLMSPREFQTRLLDGTLPDFPREEWPSGLIRDTCHEMRLLTEAEFDDNNRPNNYAEAHKGKLRYMNVEQFKQCCYNEFINME
jgi:hypothetical protein